MATGKKIYLPHGHIHTVARDLGASSANVNYLKKFVNEANGKAPYKYYAWYDAQKIRNVIKTLNRIKNASKPDNYNLNLFEKYHFNRDLLGSYILFLKNGVEKSEIFKTRLNNISKRSAVKKIQNAYIRYHTMAYNPKTEKWETRLNNTGKRLMARQMPPMN